MTAAAPTTWRIDLPITTPMSLNDFSHRMVQARRTRHVRALTSWAVRTAKVPAMNRITLELHYVPRDRRRRDRTNLVATLKPVEDGVVDAGVIPDDTPQYLRSTMPVIDDPDSTPGRHSRLYLLITGTPTVEPT